MNIALWIAQVVLAVGFLMAGSMKMMQPKEKLAENMEWVNDFGTGAVKGIGALEVLGALGAVLPKLTGILPILTPLAATGLALTMIGAALTHLRRKEMPMIGINAVLFLVAAFVAYGRFVILP